MNETDILKEKIELYNNRFLYSIAICILSTIFALGLNFSEKNKTDYIAKTTSTKGELIYVKDHIHHGGPNRTSSWSVDVKYQ